METSGFKDVKLLDLVKEKNIQLNLEGNEKAEIISELVNIVVPASNKKARKLFFKAILTRENLGSTAIGNGVAIPHAKISGITKTILAIGRSPLGVDFNSLDGEKTYVFFMLLSSEKHIGSHLKILAKISKFMRDKFVVERFKSIKGKKELLALLSSLETT